MTDYTKTGNPPQDGRGISKQIRDEFVLIENAVNSKANINSPTFTGTPSGPTASFGSSGTQFATLDYVNGVAFGSTLPAQTGNSGKLVTTDGTNASWTGDLKDNTIRIVSSAAPTKKLAFDLSGVGVGTTRTWFVEDANVRIGTPGMKLIGSAVASSSATVDLETTFDSTYDFYLITATRVVVQTDGVSLRCRLKIGGSYISTSTYDYSYDSTVVTSSSYTLVGGAAQDSIIFSSSVGNAPAEHASFRIWVSGVNNTSLYKSLNFEGYSHEQSLGRAQFIRALGYNTTLGGLTGIRIYASSGNISSGTFRVYGLRNAVV